MNIAHVMAGAVNGGAEGFYERLTVAQKAEGENVLPVIRRDAGRAARLRAGGLEPVELSFGGIFDFTTGPRLRAALRRFEPQVVVAWMNRAARFTPRGSYTLVGRLGGYYDLKYYRHCDYLVGNTRDLARWIAEQGWPADRVHYVPNFSADLKGEAPADLPAPPGMPRLLAMGRLHPNKGFDVLLRALALLPGVHLSLAGEGPERQALTRLAAELGVSERVAFLGWRRDAGALLAACDIFVCSSRHEPLGNIVLEAFSAERPVVAAAAAGPVELIRDGKNGLLVPLEAAEPMAQAIQRLLDEREAAAAIARSGRQTYQMAYAPGPVLAHWQDFLRAVSA
ncbi:glycosyltransferase [Acetobacteraceae bacterium H6797]|nr:glycosyltransferase [Acetobacteraceae bacterium H6797]